MESLDLLLNKLESNLKSKNAFNSKVSYEDVSWHIAHSLKVIYNIIKVLQNSNPEEYRWKFNRNRSFVYFLNSIPRGKGKAPKSVQPTEDLTLEFLESEFKKIRELIPELDNLEAKSNFMHPYFGQLNLKQTKKLFLIHTKHHLKIIEDIIKADSNFSNK
jgi:hypothetical protein